MSYSNARDMIRRVGRRIGRDDLTPHMFRHSHATALARAGWTTAEIAARLGQSSSSSCDVYVHLAADDSTSTSAISTPPTGAWLPTPTAT